MSATGEADASELEGITRAYLAAFEARDLARCMSFFRDDATLHWQVGVYRGSEEIQGWHRDRFDADLTIPQVEDVRVVDDVVTVDVVVTSKRLKAWRIMSLAGRVTATFQEGKVATVAFTLRITNPFEHWA